jgi:sirohydrochlorin ferrochelatase
VRHLARPVDVRAAYLEHGPPRVADVAHEGAVAVPLLLSAGYHVRVDLPRQAPGVHVTDAVGPDPRLATVLAERLREAGYDGGPVTLAAAGSADERAVADVQTAARHLQEVLDDDVTPAYLSGASPRLCEVRAQSVATYLLAPGVFADAVGATDARVVAQPIGAHRLVAEIIVDRYRAAAACQPPGRTAPA